MDEQSLRDVFKNFILQSEELAIADYDENMEMEILINNRDKRKIFQLLLDNMPDYRSSQGYIHDYVQALSFFSKEQMKQVLQTVLSGSVTDTESPQRFAIIMESIKTGKLSLEETQDIAPENFSRTLIKNCYDNQDLFMNTKGFQQIYKKIEQLQAYYNERVSHKLYEMSHEVYKSTLGDKEDYWDAHVFTRTLLEQHSTWQNTAASLLDELLQEGYYKKYYNIEFYNATLRDFFPELKEKIDTVITRDTLKDMLERNKRELFIRKCLRNTEIDGQKIERFDSRLIRDIAKTDLQDPKAISKMAQLFYKVNPRPEIYGSDYNTFYPNAVTAQLVKLDDKYVQDWMWPVLSEVRKEIIGTRTCDPKKLFDACKAWKLNPKFWKKEAIKIGKMPLKARMVASAILNSIDEEGHENYSQDWIRDKSLRADFWQKMAEAQNMGWDNAIVKYCNDDVSSRRRFLSCYQSVLSGDESKLIARTSTLDELITHQDSIKHQMRRLVYSTPKEREYFISNYNIKKWDDFNLSAQQRCTNLIISFLGKEQGLSEVKNWRLDEKYKELYAQNQDWIVPASFITAQTFGCYFPTYLKKTSPYMDVHDAVYWLPKDLSPENRDSFRQFMLNNIIYVDDSGKRHHRPIQELSTIARNWNSLKPEEQKQKYSEVLAICRAHVYENQEFSNFAAEAVRFGVSESEYKNCEDIYKAGLNVPEPFDSAKTYKFGKYTGRFLPRDDVRTGFFGEHTDCCQRFGGVGHACAESTVKDDYSQLFVIENEKGNIVAGSWTWENTEGKYRDVCFDNIEAIGEFKSHPMVNKIYEMAAKDLCETQNVRKVTAGIGYQDADTSRYEVTESIPLPSLYGNQYTDAHSQVLIRENKNALPLDKSRESERYVRDACFLDEEIMDKISEKCFPTSDANLQTPKRIEGKVLVDKEKGVVGYCLYDSKEKEIYDMAVLPQYRKDKNKSSLKLLGEVIKHVRKEGGEWSAELRDKTTLRYMEAMKERGLVSMQIQDIDHEMSDGSKVYRVTFSPIIRKESKEKQINRITTVNNDERG